MILPFYKYHGTGNDFVLINQFLIQYLKNPEPELVKSICERRFGIGADGLILLEKSEIADFKMVYFNSDGHQSTMCGNGGRCLVHLAHSLTVFKRSCRFEAIDGVHEATCHDHGLIELKMSNVSGFQRYGEDLVIHTGSPHLLVKTESVDDLDVVSEGRTRRYLEYFSPEGINVNFIEQTDQGLVVRTYERGVEDETLSCGTGVTAAALLAGEFFDDYSDADSIKIITKGGQLSVRYRRKEESFHDIWLTGPVKKVYEGQLTL